jgi:cytochrome c2
MNWNTRDKLWVAVFSIALFGIIGYIFWFQATPEWRDYQTDFRELVEKKFGASRADLVPTGVQQIWVPELKRADRCTTCHMAVEWKGLESAAEPFRTHPKEVLDKHPLNRYGCTICHGGQGYAVDFESAHAVGAEHWEHPVLGDELAKAYTVSDREAMLQTNCNVCHRYDREIKGAGVINRAKELVAQKGCRACHSINGRGGSVGPNLTNVGDLAPEQYDYSRLSGKSSVFAWHTAHFKDPKSMSPNTVMPNFGFNSKDAQALTLLVMSWKNTDLPPQYIPGFKQADVPTAEEQEKERQMMTGEGAFFVKKGCFICHEVSSLGIESAAKIGPDLSIAVTDVQSRFGRTLEDFLAAPTGTMAVVLSTQIHLTKEERDEAIQKLHLAYERKQQPSAKQAANGASGPGAKKGEQR